MVLSVLRGEVSVAASGRRAGVSEQMVHKLNVAVLWRWPEGSGPWAAGRTRRTMPSVRTSRPRWAGPMCSRTEGDGSLPTKRPVRVAVPWLTGRNLTVPRSRSRRWRRGRRCPVGLPAGATHGRGARPGLDHPGARIRQLRSMEVTVPRPRQTESFPLAVRHIVGPAAKNALSLVEHRLAVDEMPTPWLLTRSNAATSAYASSRWPRIAIVN